MSSGIVPIEKKKKYKVSREQIEGGQSFRPEFWYMGKTKLTYSAGLSMCSEKLQFLTVTKFNKNVNCPFLIVFMFADTNLACTANTWNVKVEGLQVSDDDKQIVFLSLRSKVAENFSPMLATSFSRAGCQLS